MLSILPSKDILEILFATVATIVATVTGLIGAFSTFRLQNINREVNLLKDIAIHKKTVDGQTIFDLIKKKEYNSLEKIYDRDLAGANLLKQIVVESVLNTNELLIDIDNITRNQQQHDHIKQLTIKGSRTSLMFVFLSLFLLVLTNLLLVFSQALWFVLIIYLSLTGYIFFLFVNQLKKLIE